MNEKTATLAPMKRVNIYEMETMWRNFAKLICIPRFAWVFFYCDFMYLFVTKLLKQVQYRIRIKCHENKRFGPIFYLQKKNLSLEQKSGWLICISCWLTDCDTFFVFIHQITIRLPPQQPLSTCVLTSFCHTIIGIYLLVVAYFAARNEQQQNERLCRWTF